MLAWNQFTGGAWQQTEVANNNFVLSHIFATNDMEQPIVAIQGQSTYGNVPSAREGATVEIHNLITTGLPFVEFVLIGSVIFKPATTMANAVKGATVSTDEGDDYVDFRQFTRLSTGSVSDHGNLSGLSDDDHVIYQLRDEVRLGRATVAGAGAEVIVFSSALESDDYVVSVMPEDTGAGFGSFGLKNGTRSAAGFTLTVGGAGIYHWRAQLVA